MQMDFGLTPEQEAFRDAVRDFARREVDEELIRTCEAERRPPLDVFRKLAVGGWLECGLPDADGGPGDYVTFSVLLMELARVYVPLADLCYRCVVHGGTTIGTHGTPAQKEALLPGISRGELFFVNGITEPDTGADAASVSTRAVLDGDEWVINGTKTFNTGMLFSDWVVCYARTDTEAEKHAGITAILVPVDSPGITVTPLDTVGYRTMVTSEVHYADVRVPKENVLGEVGGGWQIMVGHLDKERFGLSCICTGATHGVLDISVKYAQDRHQFGQPIGTFQAIQHMLADVAIAVHGGTLVTQDLAWRISQGMGSRKESALAKAYTARMYKEAADTGLQVFGAYGYLADAAINRHWRDSRLHPIAGGSIQIQRNIIARQLGLGRARS
jgi:alkylation response protein AidB-like acyl-CoA dehydrogenase